MKNKEFFNISQEDYAFLHGSECYRTEIQSTDQLQHKDLLQRKQSGTYYPTYQTIRQLLEQK
jgi:hypothetical protein